MSPSTGKSKATAASVDDVANLLNKLSVGSSKLKRKRPFEPSRYTYMPFFFPHHKRIVHSSNENDEVWCYRDPHRDYHQEATVVVVDRQHDDGSKYESSDNEEDGDASKDESSDNEEGDDSSDNEEDDDDIDSLCGDSSCWCHSFNDMFCGACRCPACVPRGDVPYPAFWLC